MRAALDGAATRLAAAGVESPRLDAELLLGEALGLDRAALVIRGDEPLGAGHAVRFDAMVSRREAREPVAYILGRRWFRRLELVVDRRVLIPRPETELLVEVGLKLPRGACVLEVGTGSGAVALALADERPDVRITASDRDAGALAVAQANIVRLGLAVGLVCADLLAGVTGRYDAILANLPYVAEDEWPHLAPEIVRYEPRGALVAGRVGLEAIAALVAQAAAADVRRLALEVGAGQASAVVDAMVAHGFGPVDCRNDLAGVPRVVVGVRA